MCKKFIEILLVNCDRKTETFTQHELIENSKANESECTDSRTCGKEEQLHSN